LDAAARRALFRRDPLTPEPATRGEGVDTLIDPAEVARAVTVAGGGVGGRPGDGGPGTGPVVRDLMRERGALLLGWEWQYRPERAREPFPPHQALDGRRFGTWTDPQLDTDVGSRWVGAYFHPGDHAGCRCGSSGLWACPEPGGELDEALRGDRLSPVERAVGDDDDRAGRVGTSIQNVREVHDRLRAQHIELEGARA
ncbi:MAG: hypothetical protein ACRDSN_06760, partial [Pseudonocardiaceae bacterium]